VVTKGDEVADMQFEEGCVTVCARLSTIGKT